MKPYAIGAAIGAVLIAALAWLLLMTQSQAAQTRLRDSLAAIDQTHAADTARLRSERRQVERNASILEQRSAMFKVRADSFHTTVTALERRLRAVRIDTVSRVDTLSDRNLSLDDSARIDKLVAVVALQDTIIDSLHAENTGLRDALTAESARSANLQLLVALADSATRAERERAERLNALVRSRLPRPPGKLLGFLPKPSRGVTFVLGAVAGAVIATR